MGLYLNPGMRSMRMDRNSDIYVDKSGLIALLNERVNGRERYVCSSRPRRFGKTMAANMLCAYYQRGIDARPLFEDLAIAQGPSFERHLNAYDVVFLNMAKLSSEARVCGESLSTYVTREVIADVCSYYPEAVPKEVASLSKAFTLALNSEPDHPGFVFIIDEWDAVIRESRTDKAAQETYIAFLRDLLKDCPYVALAYMTGILPIKKYGTHSVLNMFEEVSMMEPGELAPYIGFTEAEVRDLCDARSADFSELERWYDGYRLEGLHVYNPRSAVYALRNGRCSDYWTSTETYEALQTYIDLDFDGLRQAIIAMLAGEPQPIDTLTFVNDMTTFKTKDDVLTLLVHLGYLGYDRTRGEAFIPNEEIRRQFVVALSTGRRTELAKLVRNSEELLRATIDGDAEAVAAALEVARNSAVERL